MSRPDPVSGAFSYRPERRDAAQGTMAILMCQAPDTEISRDVRHSLPLLTVRIEPVAVDADPGKG
ncbi:hypothetical protein ACROSR_01215 [Roseovarius tibetensis]|uniref:hypothetical protein n=1 Tax=Roseovarius tibetensis TaxID=2685897 RepID=UPI003D7F1A32